MPLPALLLSMVAAGLLAGCLEVEQHPAWRQGEYDGKVDTLPERTHFAGDRGAWHAAIVNRNHRQNEYLRMP